MTKAKERIQATDRSGNSHYLNRQQEILYRSGWKLVSIKKRGMQRIVLWQHRDYEEVVGQGSAMMIQKLWNEAKVKP